MIVKGHSKSEYRPKLQVCEGSRRPKSHRGASLRADMTFLRRINFHRGYRRCVCIVLGIHACISSLDLILIATCAYPSIASTSEIVYLPIRVFFGVNNHCIYNFRTSFVMGNLF